MRMDRIHKLGRTFTIMALLLNAFAMGAHYFFLHQLAARSSIPSGSTVGPISGITPDGIPVLDATSSEFHCHEIRYASIHCPWCEKDQPAWEQFDAALRSYGCDSFVLAPTVADFPKHARGSVDQKFIMAMPADVASRLDLLATPTTIVADGNWKVIWSKAGTLIQNDKKEALASLNRPR
jgi:hypothetical protein